MTITLNTAMANNRPLFRSDVPGVQWSPLHMDMINASPTVVVARRRQKLYLLTARSCEYP